MTCKHVARLVTSVGVKRVSLAAENVFAAANRPCAGTASSVVPRCIEPSCPHPASGDVHICVECVYPACNADISVTCASMPTVDDDDDDDDEDGDAAGGDSLCQTQQTDSGCADGDMQLVEKFGKTKRTSHLIMHDLECSHPVSLSVDHGRLYCCRCNDFVYNPYLDAAVALQRSIAYSHRRNYLSSVAPLDYRPQLPSGHTLVRDRSKRRRVVSMKYWMPTEREVNVIKANSVMNTQFSTSACAPVGLYNLGNSCYMNSVLQAFLNAPPLRCFFLGDGHKPHCARSPMRDCLGCAMDALICDSHRGELASMSSRDPGSARDSASPSTPFLIPQRILEIVWKHADNLASYAQHDAHEFLIAALNLLNAHCRQTPPQKSSSRPVSSGAVKIASSRTIPATESHKRDSSAAGRTNTRTSDRQKSFKTASGAIKSAGVDPASPVRNMRRSSSGGYPVPNLTGMVADSTIIHTLFSGTLQSDVICCTCRNSSSTVEKFYDISLDVDTDLKSSASGRRGRGASPDNRECYPASPADGVGSRAVGSESTGFAADVKIEPMLNCQAKDPSNVTVEGSEAEGTLASSSPNATLDSESLSEFGATNTLFECLSRFTEPEMLGESSKMHCSACGIKQEAMKQMSIRSLPPILCFHFKRFEQSFAKLHKNGLVKIETAVEFPVDSLNMEGFQTSAVLQKRNEKDNGAMSPLSDGNPMFGTHALTGQDDDGKKGASAMMGNGILKPEDGCLYDLFAVVNHTGKIDRGHYTTLVRRQGLWFKCDDEKVSAVPDVGSVIRSGEAYLVYYVQHNPNFLY